jgi:hypothetical protein
VLCQLSYALHKHLIYMLRISKSTCVCHKLWPFTFGRGNKYAWRPSVGTA